MGLFCTSVSWLAFLFLASSLIVALADALPLLIVKWRALKQPPKAERTRTPTLSADGLAKLLEALKNLLLALKDLPTWFALFLAGMALVWTATSAPHLCVV